MSKDMTKAQFDAKLKEYGFVANGFMGYVRIKSPVDPKSCTNVSHHNAGERYRDKLRYLLRERDRYHERELADDKFRRENADDIALWAQLSKGAVS